MADPGTLLACAPNFRAVSGPVTQYGLPLAQRKLYRADAVVDPAPGDQRVLAGLGISLVFDLRSAAERERVPSMIWASAGATVQPIDMLAHVQGGSDLWMDFKARPDRRGAEAAMRALYAGFPDALHDHLRLLVEGIANAEGAVLIHCTAGKDRTGFAVAILLAALGVPMVRIMADYLASLGRENDQAREETRQLITGRLGFRLEEDVLDRLMTVDESYLAASFARVDQRFGGVASYLGSAGVSAEHIAALEHVLLAGASRLE
ncbi:tyrosine-protein phosphatase [Novosphingobium sp.]|uniref:tyrosine-protein phosphatase n=1 Tax=Novosphingobium sp. TaxID=1874826 RepID=UPI003BA90AC3